MADEFAKLKITRDEAPAFEPDAEMLTHITSPDSYADRLLDAELDYAEAREEYLSGGNGRESADLPRPGDLSHGRDDPGREGTGCRDPAADE